RLLERENAAQAQPRLEVLPLQIFEHHVRHAVLGDVEVEDLHDVLVTKRTCDLGLALETLVDLTISQDIRVKELDGVPPGNAQVRSLIDGAEPPLAEQTVEAIRPAEDGADTRRLHFREFTLTARGPVAQNMRMTHLFQRFAVIAAVTLA